MAAAAAPPYVHRLLDSYLTGDLLDLTGADVPPDVQERLAPVLQAVRVPPLAGARPLDHPDTVLPARGYVRPGDPPIFCDACDQRCWYWELHHLDPIGWGGDDSRRLGDRQLVWVRLDGSCHSTAHMILDTFKGVGAWNDLWLNGYDPPIPHAIVEVARRGWQLYQRRLASLVKAEAVARGFHERYEALAPRYGYETREVSAVPWHRVPDSNRELMIATAAQVLQDFDLRQVHDDAKET